MATLTSAAPSLDVAALDDGRRKAALARTGNTVERHIQLALALVLLGAAFVVAGRSSLTTRRTLV